jgi:hypothetical protein
VRAFLILADPTGNAKENHPAGSEMPERKSGTLAFTQIPARGDHSTERTAAAVDLALAAGAGKTGARNANNGTFRELLRF